jgi:hypothetical protein
MPWYDSPVKPARHYVIRSRRCRQRIAQGLGGGAPAARVALVERLPVAELEALLRDPGFRALVAHYRELAALPDEAKLRRLVELAGTMLERLIATGDLRAVAFVLHETRQGRDPRERLARGVMAEAPGLAQRPVPLEAARPPATARPADWPRPVAARPAGKRGEPFAYCAAAQADADAAGALAAAEAMRVEARLQRAAAALRAKLRAEAERDGTAAAATPEPAVAARDEARATARALHPEAGRAFAAAHQIEAGRRAFAQGDLPDTAPPPEPSPLVTPEEPQATSGIHPEPAPPEPPALPAWLDRVDHRIRLYAQKLPPHEVAFYLRRVGRFYGFDTS